MGAGGSDLLITAFSPPLMRIDGQLIPIPGEPELDQDHVEQLVLGVLDRRPEDGAAHRIARSTSRSRTTASRGSAPTASSRWARSRCRLRMIPMKLPTFEELGLPPAVEYFANLPQGLVLVTGPTGSGKSTSLAAIIDYINMNRHCHIITIEDPVEYVHSHKNSAVSQREVGSDTHSFARALRAALREDPDVILVGEMRDPETVQFALSIAETGHLVFATLHTNDAPQSLDRISDMFPVRAPEPDPRAARRLPRRRDLAAAGAPDRWRHGRRVRAPHREQRGALARARGQDAPDPQRPLGRTRRGHVHPRDLAQPPRRERADHVRRRRLAAPSHPKEIKAPAGTKPASSTRSPRT